MSCSPLLETPYPRGARHEGAKIKQSPFLVGGDSRSLALAHADLFLKGMKKHSLRTASVKNLLCTLLSSQVVMYS